MCSYEDLLKLIVMVAITAVKDIFDFIFSFLSSYHEKATEALCIGRIQTRLGVALVSELSA